MTFLSTGLKAELVAAEYCLEQSLDRRVCRRCPVVPKAIILSAKRASIKYFKACANGTGTVGTNRK